MASHKERHHLAASTGKRSPITGWVPVFWRRGSENCSLTASRVAEIDRLIDACNRVVRRPIYINQ